MKAIERIINNATARIKEEFENSECQKLADVTTTFNKMTHNYRQRIDDMKTSGLFTAEEVGEVSKALSEFLTTTYNEMYHKVHSILRMTYEF